MAVTNGVISNGAHSANGVNGAHQALERAAFDSIEDTIEAFCEH